MFMLGHDNMKSPFSSARILACFGYDVMVLKLVAWQGSDVIDPSIKASFLLSFLITQWVHWEAMADLRPLVRYGLCHQLVDLGTVVRHGQDKEGLVV